MRVFLDTNVLLATILDDADVTDESTRLRNRDALEFVTSSINVMELRAVFCQVRSQVGHVRP
jgi:predicted nucleic acid-binding protein